MFLAELFKNIVTTVMFYYQIRSYYYNEWGPSNMCDTGIKWIKNYRILDGEQLFTEYIPAKLAYFFFLNGYSSFLYNKNITYLN